ncbi:MAG: MBL fold metallo-hydrolase [Thaumarchaeota archaeon]|nr:MBL fold metallo-hydrolase [Candidatus Calditenuaceae archaeon]MDW8186592.1 MBL fold metallo-hydrolase [Nitrososphaerota archaeon]
MRSSWTHIGKGLYLIDTKGPFYPRTIAVYLLRTEKGWVLFDTGYSSSAPLVIGSLREIGVGPNDLELIVVTHAHLDHCGALFEVLEHHPNARALVHQKAYKYMLDPSRLVESTRSLFGDVNFAKMGGMRPVPEQRIDVADDGDQLVIGDKNLLIIYTPGHAPHHLSVLIDPLRYAVTGDAVAHKSPLFQRSIPATVPPRFDRDEYVRSLKKIFDHEPVLLLRPHYGPSLPSENALNEETSLVSWWMERVMTLKRELRDPVSIAWRIIDEDLGGRKDVNPYVRDAVLVFTLGAYLST